MKLYKLTDEDGQTYGETQWGDNVTHSSTGDGPLCGPGWIHAYTSPLLAVLLNPIHGNFASPRLWEAEGEVGLTDHGLKVGCKTLATMREIPLPAITTEQRVKFAILCAKAVCRDNKWIAWADDWLSGRDRSEAAAWEAAWAAAAAAEAAARAAARGAAEAAAEAWEAWAARAAARATAAAAWIDLEALAVQAVQP